MFVDNPPRSANTDTQSHYKPQVNVGKKQASMIDSSIETACETIHCLQIGQFVSDEKLVCVLYYVHVSRGFSLQMNYDAAIHLFVYYFKDMLVMYVQLLGQIMEFVYAELEMTGAFIFMFKVPIVSSSAGALTIRFICK